MIAMSDPKDTVEQVRQRHELAESGCVDPSEVEELDNVKVLLVGHKRYGSGTLANV